MTNGERMTDWWDADPEERYWVEITARTDIGADLHAPAANENDQAFWSYDLIHRLRTGDVVYHYDRNRQAIVGYSEVVGEPWADQIVWAALGMSARKQGITPHLRAGFRRGLGGFTPLPHAITKEMLIARRQALLAIRDSVRKKGQPSRFPFIPYGKADVRALQGYLTKLPRSVFEVLPELTPRHPSPIDSQLDLTQPPAGIGTTYRPANEELAVSSRDPFEVDPSLVERALKGHALAQNLLASHVSEIGATPLSPTAEGPNYDLAWRLGDELWVAEVKSCTPANQENQLRLGLGQVLRYRSILSRKLGVPVRAVLMLESEPLDPEWPLLCGELGVDLRWPDALKV